MHTHCTKQTVSQVTKKEKERKENFSLKLNWFAARTFASLSVWPIVFLFVCCLLSIEFLCVCSLADVLSSFFAEEKRQRTTVLFCFCSVQFWCCWYSTTSGTSTFDALSDKSLVRFFFTLTCNYVLSSVLLFVAAARLIIVGGARKSYFGRVICFDCFPHFSFFSLSLTHQLAPGCVRSVQRVRPF